MEATNKAATAANPAIWLISAPATNCEVSARIFEGFQLHGKDGELLELVAMDKNGNIIDRGEALRRAIFAVSVEAHRNFLKAEGHLRVLAKPAALNE